MAIGSFLAGAGQIGATAEDFVNRREMQRAQRATAQAQQLELARQERLRQGVMGMGDIGGEAPVYDIDAPGGFEEVGLRPPAQTPAPVSAAPRPAVGVQPAKAAAAKRMFAGVEVPYFNKNAPERLGLDPNAPDVSTGFAKDAALSRIGNRTSEIANTVFGRTDASRKALVTPFLPQSEKADVAFRKRASDWYTGKNARDYFARNPEMLPVAERDPLGFFRTVMTPPTKAGAAKAAAPKAGARTPVANALETNPGALRDGPYARRQPGYAGASGGFAVFDTPEQGIAAQQNLLRGSYLDKGFNTVNKIIDKYTPAADKGNSPEARRNYKAYIAGRLGIGIDTPISEDQLLAFGQAQREFETGNTVRGQGPATQRTAGVQPEGTAQVAQTRLDPSNFYLARPEAISRDTSNAIQARQEVVQMAYLYRQSGMVNEFMQARATLLQADNQIRMLQGMQGIMELEMANDPRRLAAVWSDYAGTPIQIQPRTDGTYNILVNGRVSSQGVDAARLRDTARSTFDRAYLQQRVESQTAMQLESVKSQLRVNEATATALVEAATKIQEARINGEYKLAEQREKNFEEKIFATPGGQAFLRSGGTWQQLVTDYRAPGMPESVPAGPAALPIAGITPRMVSVGTGG